jgi:hypothetical protein
MPHAKRRIFYLLFLFWPFQTQGGGIAAGSRNSRIQSTSSKTASQAVFAF